MPVYSSLPESVLDNYNNAVGSFGMDDIEIYVGDIRTAWKIYLISIPVCFVLVALWNLFLTLFAEILIWIAIIFVGLCIGVLGLAVYLYGDKYVPTGVNAPDWVDYPEA